MVLKLWSNLEAVDSCVLLRVIENDIPEQRQMALDLFLRGADFYVSEAAIGEVVYVMKKHEYTRQETVERLTDLINNSMFVYGKKFFEPIFEEYVKRPSLSFEDLVIAKRAEERGCVPVWTFDKKFARQAEVAKLVK